MYLIEEFTSKEFVEQLGTKEKFWTQNRDFLFKIGRENTLEDVSEKNACEIAKLIGLPCAEYELAVYKNGTYKKGVVSRNFLKKSELLILGNELLSGFDNSYNKEVKYGLKEYTIKKAIALVMVIVEQDLNDFVGYLVFDVLIGNQDRHHENWGCIFNPQNNTARLAPTYDHASGMASKISDAEAKERLTTKDKNRSIEKYCLRATTPFYLNGKKLKTYEVIEAIYGYSFLREKLAGWIEKINDVSVESYKKILSGIPRDLMSEAQGEFMLKMLEINTKYIYEVIKEKK